MPMPQPAGGLLARNAGPTDDLPMDRGGDAIRQAACHPSSTGHFLSKTRKLISSINKVVRGMVQSQDSRPTSFLHRLHKFEKS